MTIKKLRALYKQIRIKKPSDETVAKLNLIGKCINSDTTWQVWLIPLKYYRKLKSKVPTKSKVSPAPTF